MTQPRKTKWYTWAFALLVVPTLIIGVATHDPIAPPPNQRMQELQHSGIGVVALKRLAHDPGSLQFESVLVTQAGAACYVYRAKNAFGAMRKGTAVLAPRSAGSTFATDDDPAFAQLWAGYCTPMQGTDVTAEVSRALSG